MLKEAAEMFKDDIKTLKSTSMLKENRQMHIMKSRFLFLITT